MRLLAIFCTIFVTILNVEAVSIIQGTIVNMHQEVVPDVVVYIQEKNSSTIIGFAQSDGNGNYKLEYNGVADSIIVSISGFNIERQSVQIVGKSQKLDFKIKEKEIEIKEVQIKSQRIWGAQDTINYLVSSFSNVGDLSIGDVLQRMPGIKVENNGEIKYNGKSINKFYIENLDLLKGRYGIATNNLSAKDVATVQVLENHQPIKTLQKEEQSSDPAINLKLKEGVKGAWSVAAQVGLGIKPLLWDNSLTAMFFGKDRQFIGSYKGNNSGKDVSEELINHTRQDYLDDTPVLSVQLLSEPDIKESRYLFNNTHAVSVNGLIKTKNDRQLTINIAYISDEVNRNNNSRSLYFVNPDSILSIAESASTTSDSKRLESDISLNVNKESYYLENTLSMKGLLQNETGYIADGTKTIRQQLKSPEISVLNTLSYIGKNNSKFYSTTAFKSMQQNLLLQPNLYDNLFNVGESYAAISQNAQKYAFSSANSTSLLSVAKEYLRIEVMGDADFEIKDMSSRLYFLDEQNKELAVSVDSLRNDYNRILLTFRVTPLVRYARKYIVLDLALPASLELVDLDDEILSKNKKNTRLYFDPSLFLRYKPGFNTEFNLHYNVYHRQGDFIQAASGNILTNYRNLNSFGSNLSVINGNNLTARLNYRDILQMLFGGIGVSFDSFMSDLLPDQYYFDNLRISKLIAKTNRSSSKSVYGQAGKGLDFLSTVLSLNALYSENTSNQAVLGIISNYAFSNIKVEFGATSKCTSRSDISLSSTWEKTSSNIDNVNYYSSIKSVSNKINFVLAFSERNILKIDGEHYYNTAIESDKNKFFADAEFDIKFKKTNVSFAWTNIFNANRYITSTFSNVGSFYNVYTIRPTAFLVKVKFNLL
jgi:hypothetical protein